MLIFGEYQSIMIFCEEPIKLAHREKEKSSFGMHSQLINMNLQKDMVIRCVGIVSEV
jgi:hypothetical protein